MRVAFICSSLGPGLDGVGDYTRRLSGELIRQGHESMAIALSDPFIAKAVAGSQDIEGTSIPVVRLPSLMSLRARIAEACLALDGFAPEWISLQFVPFGFHPKGLCFGLGKWLGIMKPNVAWHVMFHELWLGLGEKASFKHRIWGTLQRLIVIDLVRRLRPRVVNTQTESYRVALRRQGIKATILPLFSNIPRVHGDAWEELLQPLVSKATGQRLRRKELYLAGVFGRVPPEWDAQRTVSTLLPLIEQFQKRLVLVFYGRNHLSPEALIKLKIALEDRAIVVIAGERSSDEISKILQTLDLGIATTPRQVIQKSGSAAAMLEHGLKLLVTRDDWHLRGGASLVEGESTRLLFPNQFAVLKSLPMRDSQPEIEPGVKRVACQMLTEMTMAFAVDSSICLKELAAVKILEA